MKNNNFQIDENRENVDKNELIDDDSIKSNIIFIGKKDDSNDSDDSFIYVKNDREEEREMQKKGNKHKDYDLIESLMKGEYFLDKKLLKRKRKQYRIIREDDELGIKNKYELKFVKLLEENDNKLRGLDPKNKNYKLEYYNMLEINHESNEEIINLKKQLNETEEMLMEMQKKVLELEKEKAKLKEENQKIAIKVGDLEYENMQNENKFAARLRNERKEAFKKSRTKCPICFSYYYRNNITFINCGHYLCRTCFNSLEHNVCPLCKRANINAVNVPHYAEDLNSEDFEAFEQNQ